MASKFSKVDTSYFHIFKELFQYWIIYFICYPYFKIFYKIKINGRENIPKGKSFIIAANHLSYFDPLVVSMAIRRPIAYMAKEELFHVKILSPIIQALGAFSVNRDKLELATIKSAKTILSTKWLLGIFPEGTRVMTGKVGKVNKGFGYLAKATNSEILPVAMVGTNTNCGKIVVNIGKPIPVPENPDDAVEAWGRSIAELTGFEYNPEQEDQQEAPAQA